MDARNKHILLVNHTRSIHGAEQVCLETARACLEKHWRVTIVLSTVFPDDGFEQLVDKRIRILHLRYRNLGVNWLRCLLIELYNVLAVIQLCRYIRKEKVDVIYSNTYTTILGAWCAMLTHRRHIWHFHEPVSPSYEYHHSMRVLVKRWALSAQHIVFICQKQQAQWMEEWQLNERIGSIVYNPIKPLVPVHRQVSDKVRIGYLGSLVERKNIEWLVRSVQQLPQDRIDWKIYGADKNDIANHLYVKTSHPEEVYSQLDILVLPSWSETMPIVPLEAMGYGVCVVQTNQSGLTELLTDEDQCLFVDPYQEDSLYLALQKCMDATYRQAIGQRGQAWIANRIKSNQFDQQITALFHE